MFYKIYQLKTGALIEVSIHLGLIAANCQDQKIIQVLTQYAKNIGLAFQIQDDILDLVGDEEKFGKDIGNDIKEGKRTLMVIKALELLPSEQKKQLRTPS